MRWDNIILGVTGLCALTATALLVRRELGGTPPPAQEVPTRVADWRSYGDAGHAIGSRQAKTVIVVFGDFQCPFCQRYATVLDSIVREYPDDVRLVERHYPLVGIHPAAAEAALAAECGEKAGAYAKIRALLYTRSDLVSVRAWGTIAGAASIADTAAFATCVAKREFQAVVDRDVEAARDLGARGTPTVLVNEQLYPVPPDGRQLRRMVARHLSK